MRTFLHMRAREGCEAAFEREWLRAAAEISKVRGNLRQDLLRSTSDPRDFTIVSEWADQASLEAFSTGPVRDRLTVALRDLREGAERMTYQVLHSLDGAEPGVRVLLTTTVRPGEEVEFEAAYAEVAEIMRGTPGHVREELLHEPGSTTYHLLAEWTSRTAFLSWVQDPAHQNRTGPLIPYLKRAFSRRIFDIRQRPEESPAPGDGTEVTTARASSSTSSEVLVVGAGPTGLTLAIELARRGVAVRVVDKRPGPNLTADKAIGVHCRTMEIWEDQGIVDEAIDRGIWLDGQIVTVNGQQVHRVEWNLPELPYAHLGLPQYETEELLTHRLEELGGRVETGLEVVSLTQDERGVDVVLSGASGKQTARAGYVVGCDGAHSAVRKSLGLEFEPGSGRFPQLFMLCDVKVDWDMPPGYLLRFLAMEEGQLRGMLVCVPLRGEGRYRIATMAPPRIMATEAGKDVPPGFMQEFEPPRLEELQVALDRLAPPGTRASDLRWSSIFRISYGIVDRYREGRVLIAGDAAHLHPPAGGQGMNTGIQDAYNLGWKLALTVQGRAAEGLLDSYEAERRPAGKEVVGRAVEAAFTEEVDVEDQKRQFLGEMHMLLSYRDSAWVSQVLDWDLTSGPGPGDRAPDVQGLSRRGVGHPVRLFDLTAGTTAHTLFLYVDSTTTDEAYDDLERQVAGLDAAYGSELRAVVVASPDAKVSGELPLYVDGDGTYRDAYSPGGPSAYLVRPDGHVGFRSCPVFPGSLREHLSQILLNTRGER